ncbi:hypothetical protein SLEP1_g2441 [Rubroshorea leprosula]|uniref:Uncharacterized protein n=1 Tax=Rubroshorea leprosula TaxID=152421 RepID=A0AAV5HN21_9ROSI|nr:hypothetical protein SLEP1_g2441 [Rubroshorea leprosula]
MNFTSFIWSNPYFMAIHRYCINSIFDFIICCKLLKF